MTLSIIHKFTSGVPNDPAAIAAGEVVPTEWNDLHSVTGTVGPEIGARTVLSADANYYISPTGNDSNPGTISQPIATISKFFTLLNPIDGSGFNIFLHLADGTYPGTFQPCGISDCNFIVFVGNTSDYTKVSINDSATGFTAMGTIINGSNGGIQFSWLTFSVAFGIFAVTPSNGGGVETNFSHVLFDSTPSGVGGGSQAISPFTIDQLTIPGQENVIIGTDPMFGNPVYIKGNWNSFIDTSSIANLTYLLRCQFVLQGTPVWGTAFATITAISFALIDSNNGYTAFSGTSTGSRYAVTQNSVINSLGNGVNALPGSSAGTTASGGQYV